MQHRLMLSTAFVAVAMFAGPATAQSPSVTTPPTTPTTLACTNAGMQYQVGEFACIAACHQQRRLARCDAVSTTASWTYVEESCPTAMINAPWPSDWTEVPVLTAMSPTPLVVNLTAIPPDGRIVFADFDEPNTITR
jgi:hypothetical protein